MGVVSRPQQCQKCQTESFIFLATSILPSQLQTLYDYYIREQDQAYNAFVLMALSVI